jgi:hypothetical protein
MITTLKIRNLTLFDAGTMSLESWLRPSKLARKIATSSTLYKITL